MRELRRIAAIGAAIGLAACRADRPLSTPPNEHDVPLQRVEAVSPLAQLALSGAPVNHAPAVRAVGTSGRALAGIAVRFVRVDAPDGGVVVTTAANGLARLDALVARSTAGPMVIEARVDTFPPIRFEIDVAERGFDLVLRVEGDPGVEGAAAIAAAERRLESLVFADLPDERLDGFSACGFGGRPPVVLDETIDDLVVFVRLREIDGVGGAGATGNPCVIRSDRGQTLVGLVELDVAEWAFLTPQLKRDFVLHELMHVMGFVPTLLNRAFPSGYTRECLALPSSGAPNVVVQDSHFTCEFARASFDEVGGGSYAGSRVPLENGATRPLGSGTLNHHWRKSVFGAELMTGWFSSGGSAPFSRVTLGMLEDLGYGVVSALADEWSVVSPGPLSRFAPPVVAIHRVDDWY
jgi:hypothetical protein